MTSDRRLDRTYGEEEIRAKLEAELPHWYYEKGWIRRRYRTGGWKGTLMVINAVSTSPRPPGTTPTSPPPMPSSSSSS